jgi:hypothetical protein
MDKQRNWSEKESEVKLQVVTEEVNELRRNFHDASCKKEWAQAKLTELQHQINMF